MAYIVQADYTFIRLSGLMRILWQKPPKPKKCSVEVSIPEACQTTLIKDRKQTCLSAKQDTLSFPTLIPHPFPQQTPNSLDSQDSSSVNEMHCVIRAEWLTQTRLQPFPFVCPDSLL
ncbi:hypothetical protein CDAR_20841 [Caerostris darwini]|uniref:Uncharacterized protein n=1 Tax=Caerostris darwini TaxID=1538125 RepID=A0AAV4VUE4_9ARAC|nr:hypothetical protein CDAR_20841 [Caerostris darwini]